MPYVVGAHSTARLRVYSYTSAAAAAAAVAPVAALRLNLLAGRSLFFLWTLHIHLVGFLQVLWFNPTVQRQVG